MSDSLWPHGLYSPWNSPGQNMEVGCHALLHEIVPTQRSNPGLPHCRWILYHLSHQESPRILEWVAYPFSSGSSWPRNRTRGLPLTGRFFTSWAVLFTLWHCHSSHQVIGSTSPPLNLDGSLWVPQHTKFGQSDTMLVSGFKASKTGSLHVLPLGMLIFRIQPPSCMETQFTWRSHRWLFWLSWLKF